LKKDPTLRKLAKAVSEEFDENGNFTGDDPEYQRRISKKTLKLIPLSQKD